MFALMSGQGRIGNARKCTSRLSSKKSFASKDTFAATTRERDAYAQENQRLKELLVAHGISFDLSTPTLNGMAQTRSGYGSSSGNGSAYGPGSASTGFTSPPQSFQGRGSGPQDHLGQHSLNAQQQGQQRSPHQQNGLDYDQVGIDFVLTYERTPYLSPPPQQ